MLIDVHVYVNHMYMFVGGGGGVFQNCRHRKKQYSFFYIIVLSMLSALWPDFENLKSCFFQDTGNSTFCGLQQNKTITTRNWLQARLSVYPPQNYLTMADNFLNQTCRKFVKDIFSAL